MMRFRPLDRVGYKTVQRSVFFVKQLPDMRRFFRNGHYAGFMTRQYAKGIAKREEILQVALRLIAERGYTAATIRELAEAVNLSKTGLLHHFGTKEELFAEILDRRDALASDLVVPLETYSASDLAETLSQAIRGNQEVAGLVQLYVRFSNEATDPDHPAHKHFAARYNAVRAELTSVFARLEAEGSMRLHADPESTATLLVATLDGLQTQWLFDPSIDMAKHVDRFMLMAGEFLGAEREVNQ